MLREFSKELAEDREFEIGGEVFRFIYPHWKDGALLFDDEMDEVKAAAEGAETNGVFSFVADTETAIKRIPLFLDPDFNDSHKRFKALMQRKTNPIPRHQVAQLYRWLVEVTSGLPTNPPSESDSGGGASADSSVEGAS